MQPSSQGSSQPTKLSPHQSRYTSTIVISSPQMDQQRGHFTYLISGHDKHGQIEIRRRYNDFYYLRESLKKLWPGIYIPPVPQKMITGNRDQSNIEMRKRYFDYFMQGLQSNQHLMTSPVLNQFFRNKTIDMEKHFTTSTYPKPQETIKLYNNLFQNTLVRHKIETTAEQRKNLSQFLNYLKKADKQLKHMKTILQQIIDSRNVFLTNLYNVTSSTLPEYQKRVYSEYLQQKQPNEDLWFVSRPQVQQSVRDLKQSTQQNSFQTVLDMISYEILQLQAMQELINDRDNFEVHYHKSNQKLLSAESQLTKLMGGKTTLKSFFSKGNKDEQIKNLQKQVPQMKIQVQNWKEFVAMITTMITERQIPLFKKYKQLKYYQVMHTTSQKQLNYLNVYGELMKSLMQGIIKTK